MRADRLVVSDVWQDLLARWSLTRTRQDQAIPNRDLDCDPKHQLKVEIGYGSGTIRVRLIRGYQLTTFWDIHTRDTVSGYSEFLAAFETAMLDHGVRERTGE